MRTEMEVIKEILEWAKRQEKVRAVLLTGSRANPGAFTDILSDYDVIFVVNDLPEYAGDDSWVSKFGEVITSFKDEFIWKEHGGVKTYTRLMQYSDGIRIDFSLWPIELLELISETKTLPDSLDIGYKVLLDKDRLTKELKPPTHRAYDISPPTEAEFLTQVREFWWDITYVPKALWRDELFFAKYMMEHIRFGFFEKVLNWYIGMRHNWSVNPGKHGRWYKHYLEPELYERLEKTFFGSELKENLDAMFQLIELFRYFGIELAKSLGYNYPMHLDEKVSKYITAIEKLSRNAKERSAGF